jgi:outer membrane protein, multidrug efflux system
MHKLSVVSAAALALMTGACNLAPPVGSASADVSARFPGKTGGEVSADIAWRKFFTDPRLRKLVETALANNRDLRIAALNVEQARAQYGISRAELFPAVSGSVSAERQRSMGQNNMPAMESDRYDVRVGMVSYELDLFGKIRNRNQAALNNTSPPMPPASPPRSRSSPRSPTNTCPSAPCRSKSTSRSRPSKASTPPMT